LLSALFSIATSACPSSARAKFRFRICSVRHALACGLPKTQDLLNGHARSVGYQYAANGLLAAITYPDGRSLQYQYDATGQITGLTWAGQAIVRGITWNPLGQPTGWSWSLPGAAAAIPATRNYNSAGQLTATELGSYPVRRGRAHRHPQAKTLAPGQHQPAGPAPSARPPPPGTPATTAPGAWPASAKPPPLARRPTPSPSSTTPTATSWAASANAPAPPPPAATAQRPATTNCSASSKPAPAAPAAPAPASTTSTTAPANLQTNGLHRYSYDSQGRLQSASTGQGSPDAPTTRYAHNALGQRVFKTEALYNTSSNALDEDEEDLGFLQSIAAVLRPPVEPKGQRRRTPRLGLSLRRRTPACWASTAWAGPTAEGRASTSTCRLPAGLMPIAAEIDGQHLRHPQRPPEHPEQTHPKPMGRPAWQWAYSAYGDEAPTLGAKRFTNETTKPNDRHQPASFLYALTCATLVSTFDEETGLHYNWLPQLRSEGGEVYAGRSDWAGWGVESVWVCGRKSVGVRRPNGSGDAMQMGWISTYLRKHASTS
jgi:YD repeat-containing protein